MRLAFFKLKPARSAPAPVYALCEKVTAGPTTPKHIRLLTGAGMFPGGGADGPSLCGAKVAWDTVPVELADIPRIVANEHECYRFCKACVTAAATL